MRTITHLRRAIFAFILFCLPAQGGAEITFETLPQGTPPTDNAELHSSYTDGPTVVDFGFDTNGDSIIDVPAHFERRGFQDFIFAYQASPGDNDDADKTATHEGGTWLLRAPQLNEPSGPLSISQGAAFLVKYDGTLPVNISGQIWDIDSGEQIKIEVFDASRRLIASALSFVGPGDNCCNGSTDGLPFTYSFSNLRAPAAVVKITETQGHPFSTFGFDNFSSCALDCETSNVSGDYDSDDVTDIAIWRPSTGEWWILTSSSTFSSFFVRSWGSAGDVPVVDQLSILRQLRVIP